MNHARTSFSTVIFAGAIISVVQCLAPLRYAFEGTFALKYDIISGIESSKPSEIDSSKAYSFRIPIGTGPTIQNLLALLCQLSYGLSVGSDTNVRGQLC
jgi:hypothetical protein